MNVRTIEVLPHILGGRPFYWRRWQGNDDLVNALVYSWGRMFPSVYAIQGREVSLFTKKILLNLFSRRRRSIGNAEVNTLMRRNRRVSKTRIMNTKEVAREN